MGFYSTSGAGYEQLKRLTTESLSNYIDSIYDNNVVLVGVRKNIEMDNTLHVDVRGIGAYIVENLENIIKIYQHKEVLLEYEWYKRHDNYYTHISILFNDSSVKQHFLEIYY